MASGPLVPPTLTEPAPEDQLTVNLHVVSPSVGVNRPIIFPGLSALTTLQQLKDRIRQSLPSRPPDEYQRLIHRGRVLQRDQDTLLDVFGAETVRLSSAGCLTADGFCSLIQVLRSSEVPISKLFILWCEILPMRITPAYRLPFEARVPRPG